MGKKSSSPHVRKKQDLYYLLLTTVLQELTLRKLEHTN